MSQTQTQGFYHRLNSYSRKKQHATQPIQLMFLPSSISGGLPNRMLSIHLATVIQNLSNSLLVSYRTLLGDKRTQQLLTVPEPVLGEKRLPYSYDLFSHSPGTMILFKPFPLYCSLGTALPSGVFIRHYARHHDYFIFQDYFMSFSHSGSFN